MERYFRNSVPFLTRSIFTFRSCNLLSLFFCTQIFQKNLFFDNDFQPEAITEKDKEMLQNMMAYGRDKPPIHSVKKKTVIDMEPEDEIDRFEEGSIFRLYC